MATSDLMWFVQGDVLEYADWGETRCRWDVYDVVQEDLRSTVWLADLAERCRPLTWHLRDAYDEARQALADRAKKARPSLRASLRRKLRGMPEEPESTDVVRWLGGLADRERRKLVPSIRAWLREQPDCSYEEHWFTSPATADAFAFQYFESMAFDDQDALGVELHDGVAPGNDYQYATLTKPIEVANAEAERRGLAVRFRAARRR